MVVPSELPSTRTGAPAGPLILADSSTGTARPPPQGSPLTPGSDIEEDRLLISLQVNIEAQPARRARVRRGDQGGCPGRADRGEDRVGRVRPVLVGEVDPRHDPV